MNNHRLPGSAHRAQAPCSAAPGFKDLSDDELADLRNRRLGLRLSAFPCLRQHERQWTTWMLPMVPRRLALARKRRRAGQEEALPSAWPSAPLEKQAMKLSGRASKQGWANRPGKSSNQPCLGCYRRTELAPLIPTHPEVLAIFDNCMNQGMRTVREWSPTKDTCRPGWANCHFPAMAGWLMSRCLARARRSGVSLCRGLLFGFWQELGALPGSPAVGPSASDGVAACGEFRPRIQFARIPQSHPTFRFGWRQPPSVKKKCGARASRTVLPTAANSNRALATPNSLFF